MAQKEAEEMRIQAEKDAAAIPADLMDSEGEEAENLPPVEIAKRESEGTELMKRM